MNSPFDIDERRVSEETARAIDAEVRVLIDAAHERALAILRARRPVLEEIAQALLARETLERDELERIIERAGIPMRNGRHESSEPEKTIAPSDPVGTGA